MYLINYAGVDEVGRGCLAGPVTVCALRLNNTSLNHVLMDSKKLSGLKREMLYSKIVEIAEFSIVSLDAAYIDRVNIFQATMQAMREALEKLKPDGAYIDGNKIPNTYISCQAIVGGDGIVPQISAASIIAKVTRDRYMTQLAQEYPEYGFEEHKGYGTKKHLEAIKDYGITSYHRKSFSPIRNYLLT